MAWSQKARYAAIQARRNKGFSRKNSATYKVGAQKSGMGYTVTAKQAGHHGQFKKNAKKVAKYGAIGFAAGAAGGAAYQVNKYSSSPQRAANLRKKADIARVKSNAARKYSRQGLNVPKTRVNSKAFDRASIRYGRQHAKYKAKAKYVTAKGIYKAR